MGRLTTAKIGILSCVNEEERDIIGNRDPRDKKLLDQYADWLRSQGYPKLAERTRTFKDSGKMAAVTSPAWSSKRGCVTEPQLQL